MSPTRLPFPMPAWTKAAGQIRCGEIEFAIAQPAVGIDHALACPRPGLTEAGPVHRSCQASNSLFMYCRSGFPLASMGSVGRRYDGEAPGDLVGRKLRGKVASKRGFVELDAAIHTDDGDDDLAAIRVGDAEHVRRDSAGDLGDGLLDLAGRDVRSGRFDHRTTAAEVVHEPVVVGGSQVPGVQPAVGVETFFAAAPVITLHQAWSANAEFAARTVFDRRAGVQVDDRDLQPRRRFAVRTAPMLGLVGLVAADQRNTARLGQARACCVATRGRPGGPPESMIGYRFPRRIDVRSRPVKLGCWVRFMIPATNPLVIVGLSASSRSRVRPALVRCSSTPATPRQPCWPARRTPIRRSRRTANCRTIGPPR